MPLGFTIGQPPSNGVVIIGEKTLVSGIAIQGPAAPSPCSSTARDIVTVQIGGGPPPRSLSGPSDPRQLVGDF